MPPPLVFADAPALVLGHLADRFAGDGDPIPTGSDIPNPRPPRFVVGRLAGTDRETVVTAAATVVVDCWADTPAGAADLAQAARAWLDELPGTTVDGWRVYALRDVQGPAELDDALTNQPRHTFSVQLVTRGRRPS